MLREKTVQSWSIFPALCKGYANQATVFFLHFFLNISALNKVSFMVRLRDSKVCPNFIKEKNWNPPNALSSARLFCYVRKEVLEIFDRDFL